MTEQHRLDGLDNRNAFLIILEAGSPKSGSGSVPFLMRALFLAGK